MKTLITILVLFFSSSAHSDSALTESMLSPLRDLERAITDGYAVATLEGDYDIQVVEFENQPWVNVEEGVAVLFSMSAWGKGNNNSQVLALLARNDIHDPRMIEYRLVAFAHVGARHGVTVELVDVVNGEINLFGATLINYTRLISDNSAYYDQDYPYETHDIFYVYDGRSLSLKSVETNTYINRDVAHTQVKRRY